MKSMTMQCKKEDAQSVFNPDHLRQARLVHLSGKYPLRVSQRIRKFGPTTVSVSQGKGGKKFAPSGGPCVRPVVLGVKRNERKSCRGRGVYICHDEKEEHPTTDGIDLAKMGDRRPAVDTGASILEVYLVVPRP